MNKHRKTLLFLCTVCAVAPAAHAGFPFARGELLLLVAGGIERDSNVFSDNTEQSDTIWNLTPSARFVRSAGLTSLDASTGVNIQRFNNFSSENTEDGFVSVNLSYDSASKTTFDGTFDYRRSSQADETVLARIESNVLSANGDFSHLFSEKLGYNLVGSVNESWQKTAGFSDTRSYRFGLNGVYQYSPKLRGLAGFSYSTSDTGGGPTGVVSPAADDFALNLGLQGDVSAKVTGSISVGYNWRDFDSNVLGNDSGLVTDTRLTWRAKPALSISAFASRGYSVTVNEKSALRDAIGLAANGTFAVKGTVNGSISYEDSEYTGSLLATNRSDNAINLSGGLGWNFSENASVTTSLSYRDVSSSLAFADYDRLRLSLSGNYTF